MRLVGNEGELRLVGDGFGSDEVDHLHVGAVVAAGL
jgi:hypothetical protein